MVKAGDSKPRDCRFDPDQAHQINNYMRYMFYVSASIEPLIVEWCKTHLSVGEVLTDRRYQYFPFYMQDSGRDTMTRFDIYNDDDALLFNLKWAEHVRRRNTKT